MFRLIGNLIKLVTMISTLMLAVEQIREVMSRRKANKNAEEVIENAKAA